MNKENFKTIRNIILTGAAVTIITNSGIKMVLNRDYVHNIYNSKNLKVSELEKEELFKMLEEESGLENLNDERDLILTAVIDNPNLTEEEKQIIYKLVDIIEDNPYINKKTAYANLKNLDIQHVDRDENVSDDINGEYLPISNEINIYAEDDDHSVLIHEIIHCIFTNSHSYVLPRYLSEGTTELLVDEYFTDTPFVEENCYPYEIAMVKILCEMVGPDVVLETYSTGDMSIICNKLTEVMDEDTAKSYLDLLNKMFEDYNSEGKVVFEDMSTFLATTKDYFKAKDGDVRNEAYEYNKELLINLKNKYPTNDYIYYVIENGYYKKPYFSTKLKQDTKKYYLEKEKSSVFEDIL